MWSRVKVVLKCLCPNFIDIYSTGYYLILDTDYLHKLTVQQQSRICTVYLWQEPYSSSPCSMTSVTVAACHPCFGSNILWRSWASSATVNEQCCAPWINVPTSCINDSMSFHHLHEVNKIDSSTGGLSLSMKSLSWQRSEFGNKRYLSLSWIEQCLILMRDWVDGGGYRSLREAPCIFFSRCILLSQNAGAAGPDEVRPQYNYAFPQ